MSIILNTSHKATLGSLSSLFRHCEERSSLSEKSQRSLGNTQRKRATKQSSFTNQLTRAFYNAYKNHSTSKPEQGDCFADSFTANVVNTKSFSTLRLAMTNVGDWVRSPQNVDSDKRKRKLDFVGCVFRCMKFERMRTATQLATTNDSDCKRCASAPSAPYTLTARFV
jgi:hypothetical protein